MIFSPLKLSNRKTLNRSPFIVYNFTKQGRCCEWVWIPLSTPTGPIAGQPRPFSSNSRDGSDRKVPSQFIGKGAGTALSSTKSSGVKNSKAVSTRHKKISPDSKKIKRISTPSLSSKPSKSTAKKNVLHPGKATTTQLKPAAPAQTEQKKLTPEEAAAELDLLLKELVKSWKKKKVFEKKMMHRAQKLADKSVKKYLASFKTYISSTARPRETLQPAELEWPKVLQTLSSTCRRPALYMFSRLSFKKKNIHSNTLKRRPFCDKWRPTDLKKIKSFLARKAAMPWKGLRWKAFHRIRLFRYNSSSEYERLKSICYGNRLAMFYEKFTSLFPFYDPALLKKKYGKLSFFVKPFAFSSFVLDWGWEASLLRKSLKRIKRLKFMRKRALSTAIPGVREPAVAPKRPLDSLVRAISITPNRILKKSKLVKVFPWKYGKNSDEKYIDVSFGQDIIDSKKRRFHMFKYNPVSQKSLDLNANKFFFHNMKRDPIYNSFLLEKVISAFATHGRRSKIRKVFYRIFLTDKHDYSISTLYAVIGALRPSHINVPVRMAARYYYAPIKASPMRSTMRAIRFFKMAVLSNTHEKSLEGKILCELEHTFESWGYVNPYYHDYVTLSENSKYLAHFRKRRVI